MARLGDVCEKKIDTIKATYTGNIDYIDISSVDNQRKEITKTQSMLFEDAPSRAKQLVFPGDILVSTVRPNLNAVALITDNSDNILVASTGYCILRCLPNVDRKYVFYFCQSNAFIEKLVMQATGASYPAVTSTIVKECIIPLPSLDKQRQIAAVLDKVSDLIAKRRQQLDKLDLLVKSKFVEMFGDFKTNTMGWSVVGFKEIAIIDGNMTTDYKKYANYPHIGIDSIEKETGKLNGYRTIAEDGVISGKYVFTAKHIIYSKIRPNLNKVALPEFDGLCSADAYPILPIEGKCNRIFLAYNMRSQFFLDYILQFCNRTNLPKVNRREVEGFKTPLPPIELQNKFSDFVEQTEKTKTSISQSLEKLETLKKALMQEYFG